MKWFKVIPLLLAALGNVVGDQIRAISVYGLETTWGDFVCHWKKDISVYIKELKALDFNALRLPFSYEYVIKGDFSRMDHFFRTAYENNMTIIADLHRVWNSHQGPDPFENGVTMDQFVDCWKTICRRYFYFPNFLHMNSYNEYQGTNASFVNEYSSTLFKAIEKEFPMRYIYWVTGISWAGDLRGINLDYLPFKNRIGYSVHKYPFSKPADAGEDFDFEKNWDETIPLTIDPERLIIGEWSWRDWMPEEIEWAKRFIAYLKKRKIKHTAYWTLSHSHDTGNMYNDDCDVIKWDNYLLLKTLWQDEKKYLRKNTCRFVGWNGCIG